jgi:hypothetical protein
VTGCFDVLPTDRNHPKAAIGWFSLPETTYSPRNPMISDSQREISQTICALQQWLKRFPEAPEIHREMVTQSIELLRPLGVAYYECPPPAIGGIPLEGF